jgi:hypothetical protein
MRVISASRRVELVACYPEVLARALRRKCPPDTTHTVVLWSKDPRNLLRPGPLRDALAMYRQLYLHLTVTGMGGSFLEPRVLPQAEALALLPELVRFLGTARRIRVRFDPIVHIIFPNGDRFTNLSSFEEIARAAAAAGVPAVTTSWMASYRKVRDRLVRRGLKAEPVSDDRWLEEAVYLRGVSARHGLLLEGCCVAGWPQGRCIDGALLGRLHPDGETAPTARAKGQREFCGCTESYDVGWYVSCLHGCLYCYASPAEALEARLQEPGPIRP